MTYQELVKCYPWIDLALELFKGIMPTVVALFTIFMTELFIRKRNKADKKREMELQYLEKMLSWIHETRQNVFEISSSLSNVLLMRNILDRVSKFNEVLGKVTEMNKAVFVLSDTYKEISSCMGYDFNLDQFKDAVDCYCETINDIGVRYLRLISTETATDEINYVTVKTSEEMKVTSSLIASKINLLYGKALNYVILKGDNERKRKFMSKKKLYTPYGFDEKVEYKVYTQIGEEHRNEFFGKKEKRREKFLSFAKYSEWERYFIDKFLNGDNNDCNFRHYLIKKIRIQKRCDELYKTVAVPIYIMMVSVIISMYSSKNYPILLLNETLIVGIIIILIASLYSIHVCTAKKCFYEDCLKVIENFNTSHQN